MSGAVSKNCWNLLDSYGLICTGCNCCGRSNKETMHADRRRIAIRHLHETVCKLNHPDFQSNLQQRNIIEDIKYNLEKIEAAMAFIDFGPPEPFTITEKDIIAAIKGEFDDA